MDSIEFHKRVKEAKDRAHGRCTEVLKGCGVDPALLNPRRSWPSPTEYDEAASTLAKLFRNNIRKFRTSEPVLEAGPRVEPGPWHGHGGHATG